MAAFLNCVASKNRLVEDVHPTVMFCKFDSSPCAGS